MIITRPTARMWRADLTRPNDVRYVIGYGWTAQEAIDNAKQKDREERAKEPKT